MKLIFVIGMGLTCLLFSNVGHSLENRMSNNPSLKLSGHIESSEVADEGDRVKLSFKLNLSFRNTGDAPILLLAEKPTVIGRRISCSSKNGQSEDSLFTLWTRPSISKNDGWLKLSKDVNTATPPEGSIRRIEVGETFKMEAADWFYINKDEKSWNELASADRLSLRLTYEVWPLNIEPRQSTLDDKKLGQELRERWKSFGYLWTDEITSEPLNFTVQLRK